MDRAEDCSPPADVAASAGGGIADDGSTLRLPATEVDGNHAGGSVTLTGTRVADNAPDEWTPPGAVPGCPA
ncbi:hypothetical protein [Streptomyces sp. SD15]